MFIINSLLVSVLAKLNQDHTFVPSKRHGLGAIIVVSRCLQTQDDRAYFKCEPVGYIFTNQQCTTGSRQGRAQILPSKQFNPACPARTVLGGEVAAVCLQTELP